MSAFVVLPPPAPPLFFPHDNASSVHALNDGFKDLGLSLSVLIATVLIAAVCYLYHGSSSSSSLGDTRKGCPDGPREHESSEDHHLRTTVVEPGLHGVRHLAVIMDGNRRYGKRLLQEQQQHHQQQQPACSDDSPQQQRDSDSTATATSPTGWLKSIALSPLNGHRAGGEKLLEFVEYSLAYRIEMLTVYAFSTENWQRPQAEVDVLMLLFEHFFQRIRSVAQEKGIFIRFVSTEPQRLPPRILALMEAVEEETRNVSPRRIVVNCCVSYGGRSEIAAACTHIAQQHHEKSKQQPQRQQDEVPLQFTEELIAAHMLRSITQHKHEDADRDVLSRCGGAEPQVLLRTSGEARVSNFLLYEVAYTEFVFVDKAWPEIVASDVESLLMTYCRRQRRFGR